MSVSIEIFSSSLYLLFSQRFFYISFLILPHDCIAFELSSLNDCNHSHFRSSINHESRRILRLSLNSLAWRPLSRPRLSTRWSLLSDLFVFSTGSQGNVPIILRGTWVTETRSISIRNGHSESIKAVRDS